MTHLSAFMRKFAKAVIIMAVLSGISVNGASTEQGIYFAKKKYVPKPLPVFENTKDKLPAPIYDEHPNYVSCYWKAWELAFKNFHEPSPQSGFVSQYIDAAFNQNIFLWDSCFLTMFCNYAHPYVPGIGTLDNFYAKQYEDGEICREIDRKTGKGWKPWINKEDKPLFTRWGYSTDEKEDEVLYRGRDIPKPNPKITLDALNHLACVVDVYKESGTIWENYAPQSLSRGSPSRKDFVGWSGLGPIAFLIEYAIGIKADAPGNLICWNIHSDKRLGIKRFWFGGNTVSLVCEEAASDGDFLKQAQGLSFNDRLDILLEIRLSGVAEQEYDVVWKSRVTYYRRLRFHRLSQFKDVL